MYWNEICITIEPERIEEANIFFYNQGILSLNIEDPNDIEEHQNKVRWDYIDEEILQRDKNKAFVKVYIEEDDEANRIVEEGKEQGFNITDDLVIVPAWEDYDKKGDEKIITLDSGMAFGTGTHETTKMCVSFIKDIVSEDTKKVLDIGCGSGILSIAASRYGAKDILAVDIDELAVKIAKENVFLNDLDDSIKVIEGDLTKNVEGKFDLIIANIVADIIKELIPEIRTYLKDNGKFIISGIIKEREEEVYNFAKEHGFNIEKVSSNGGWSAMLLS